MEEKHKNWYQLLSNQEVFRFPQEKVAEWVFAAHSFIQQILLFEVDFMCSGIFLKIKMCFCCYCCCFSLWHIKIKEIKWKKASSFQHCREYLPFNEFEKGTMVWRRRWRRMAAISTNKAQLAKSTSSSWIQMQ